MKKLGIILNSVIGLQIKNPSTTDKEGNILKCNVLKTVYPETKENPKIGTSLGGNLWFDNWNQSLLNKVSNCKNQIINSY